ncbi:glycerophosphoryl diester phosphodiesterase [Segniliparus rotundus DSM 44985]|uniref:glycerophosphodiester phosphodiesterase n=1 Tax=Segniliparus rotundus (strain ATCC BAA-972 / CDC 1076 / CIP 108378 / DSM 44985 / JCM 13578) TaxID=640132 RepID=D6ZDQ5_SEGRD|nr:glycerophosphodiester phosphodiesterase family protein [Segniliparus rotundus]ADG99312.1 glycerophosphoryl diester phosphodiesterase [Segniliparus rotundus DSM 44985]
MSTQQIAAWPLALLVSVAAMSACGGPAAGQPKPFATLDGSKPLVIAHRGLPGLRPEETRPAYELAADLGADALEEDLHLTKDCVLIARHNPWMSDNTDVVEVAKTNPEVAARKRTTPGVARPAPAAQGSPKTYLVDQSDPDDPKSVLKSLVVDGEDHVGGWSVSDFTAAELQRWFHGSTYDAKDERPSEHNGKYPILTFQQIIDIAKAKSAATGRQIAIYPETKNPTWNNEQAIANGCGATGSRPLEDAYLNILEKNGLNNRDAPVFAQSFEPSSLKYLREHGLKTKAVQLVGGHDVDFRTGEVVYDDITNSRPYDWTLAGDARWFSALLTPEGLAEVRTYADGIGPWKPQLVPLTIRPYPADPAFRPSTAQAAAGQPDSVVADAHKAGLFVHVYTFRDERRYLASNYQGDPKAEYAQFFRLGVDGVFTDFTNTAVSARQAYLKELGR